ncbi:Adenylosuccinate synthetase [Clarias magur]|uniref:Adenylosuccinate synthetase n=1 Tax=Clarias magur TaxID=1594786 RepID=A0A8J4XHH5_CLAMG|nr:Adenylosuccinate synthetase [Clarias magur]
MDGRELRPGSPNYNCVKEAVVRQHRCSHRRRLGRLTPGVREAPVLLEKALEMGKGFVTKLTEWDRDSQHICSCPLNN